MEIEDSRVAVLKLLWIKTVVEIEDAELIIIIVQMFLENADF